MSVICPNCGHLAEGTECTWCHYPLPQNTVASGKKPAPQTGNGTPSKPAAPAPKAPDKAEEAAAETNAPIRREDQKPPRVNAEEKNWFDYELKKVTQEARDFFRKDKSKEALTYGERIDKVIGQAAENVVSVEDYGNVIDRIIAINPVIEYDDRLDQDIKSLARYIENDEHLARLELENLSCPSSITESIAVKERIAGGHLYFRRAYSMGSDEVLRWLGELRKALKAVTFTQPAPQPVYTFRRRLPPPGEVGIVAFRSPARHAYKAKLNYRWPYLFLDDLLRGRHGEKRPRPYRRNLIIPASRFYMNFRREWDLYHAKDPMAIKIITPEGIKWLNRNLLTDQELELYARFVLELLAVEAHWEDYGIRYCYPSVTMVRFISRLLKTYPAADLLGDVLQPDARVWPIWDRLAGQKRAPLMAMNQPERENAALRHRPVVVHQKNFRRAMQRAARDDGYVVKLHWRRPGRFTVRYGRA
jgi:hypothetical protein